MNHAALIQMMSRLSTRLVFVHGSAALHASISSFGRKEQSMQPLDSRASYRTPFASVYVFSSITYATRKREPL